MNFDGWSSNVPKLIAALGGLVGEMREIMVHGPHNWAASCPDLPKRILSLQRQVNEIIEEMNFAEDVFSEDVKEEQDEVEN